MKLLERDELLAQLQTHLQRAAAGPGMLVFVEGEAGIGKTAVLKSFADRQQPELPVRWGACDALQTPRPLGPLYDIAAQAAGELQTALDSDAERLRVFGAFLQLLATQPSLVLLEDLHWADQATLDLLRYIGRRMARTRSLVVASFRSDEIGPSHPLRLLLGDLATSGVQRLAPQPLSIDAVRELAGNRDIDVPELHRTTGGNPFFVTEVLADSGVDVPATVRDAVLTRAARLGPSPRAILDAAAVAGPRIEPWLLQDLAAAESGGSVEECLATGVLRVEDGVFVFRHELARQAVLQALTPTRLLSLHRLVLQALQSPAAPTADLARLAHHAEGAGLEDAVLCARPMIERVHHKLRAAGVRGLPRGPRKTTQEHPAGLTNKEVAVFALLAQGLRNKEIGQRLHRSARTVDHHLAAIFAKLNVATRAEAVSAAYRLGFMSTGENSANS